MNDYINKLLILETPTEIKLSDDKLLDTNDAVQVFVIYDDLTDKELYWVSYDTKRNKLISDNSNIISEILPANVLKYKDQIKRRNPKSTYGLHTLKNKLSVIKSAEHHYSIIALLDLLGRATIQKYSPSIPNSDSYICGRIFKDTDTDLYYMACWDKDSIILKNKRIFDEFLSKADIDLSKLYIEDQHEKLHKYADFFTSRKRDPNYQLRLQKANIHKMSSMLPKSYAQQLRNLK